MRVAVFGTGGVGGYFGGRLAEAGEDVIFIARGDHLRAIKEKGLKVDSPDGDFVIYPATATDTVSDVGTVDLVIVGVKAWQVPEAARAMRPLVGANTTVLPLQNGVDAVQQLVDALGSESVIGGLCRIVSLSSSLVIFGTLVPRLLPHLPLLSANSTTDYPDASPRLSNCSSAPVWR
jgi:2-dehydropantoate 2-reductase